MVDIKCNTKDRILLVACEPFQGNLKKRTDEDLDKLKQSILTEGLLMPFAIWRHDNKNYLLDGHARREALLSLAKDTPELLEQEYPCVYIDADTEDEARKALLQITSQYGKITKVGYKQFTVSIPSYTAPSVAKFVPKAVKSVKVPEAQKKVKVLKIRVPTEKYDQVLEIFKSIDYIEVL